MNQNLLQLFNSIIPISDELEKRLSETLQTNTYPKKYLLLKEGQVCNYIYFIEKGFLRSYYINHDKEITGWFMKENDIIVSVNSFFKRIVSYENIQTIEESTLHYIHYNELQNIYKDFIEFNIVGRVLAEMYYVLSEERLYGMRSHTAEERLQFLLDKHPEILLRAPLGYIASYLGISSETLSRIRGYK
jgi:CRP-like cAMP-binding protein